MFFFVSVLRAGSEKGPIMAGITPESTPTAAPRARRSGGGRAAVFRWQCRCQEPPVLLATYEADGRVNIKVRDRYWHVQGQVQTICPRCGAEHVLDLRETSAPAPSGGRHGSVAEPPPTVAKG